MAGWGSFDPVLAGRSRTRATKCVPLAKLWSVQNRCISQNLWNWACPHNSLLPIAAWASSILKILGDTFILGTAMLAIFFWNEGQLRHPYFGLKPLYPPLPHIFWTTWTWGFTRYHLKFTIPIKTWSKSIEWSVFRGIFSHFWAREPNLYSKFSDFDFLSV